MPIITDYRTNVDASKSFNYIGYLDTTEDTYTLPFAANKVTIRNSGSNTIQITSVSPAVNIAPFDVYTLENVSSIKLKTSSSASTVHILGFKQALNEEDEYAIINRRYGYKIGFGGDSITNGSAATNASVYSFRAYLPKILGYRITSDSYNGGVPGERSDQLLARMDGIISQGVKVLSIMIGTNDASQLVSLSTYQSNIKAIKEKADKAGIPIIFCLVPPRGSSASTEIKSLITAYNLWLRFWGVQNGVPIVDTFAVLADKTTGNMSATYDSGDGVHPNNAGHLELAKAISSVLDSLLPKMPWIVNSKGIGLVANPLNDSGVAASLTHLAGTFVSGTFVTNDGTLPFGDWRKYTLDNSGGGSSINTTFGITMDTAKYVVGDVLLFALYIRTSVAGKLQFLDNSSALTVPFDALATNTVVPIMIKRTVPTTAGTYRLGFNITAAAGTIQTFEIGAFDVFNLTTLGLTDIVV